MKALKMAVQESQLTTKCGPESEIGIIFLSETDMTELNQSYLKHDGSTDVITFDYRDDDDEPLIGEIYVCLDVAERAAIRYTTSFTKEVVLYCVHGILHLCGLNDKTEKQRSQMRIAERKVMTTLDSQFNLNTIFGK
jgi:rRNA maturation RNase YbeY